MLRSACLGCSIRALINRLRAVALKKAHPNLTCDGIQRSTKRNKHVCTPCGNVLGAMQGMNTSAHSVERPFCVHRMSFPKVKKKGVSERARPDMNRPKGPFYIGRRTVFLPP
jgi:hypothetical protein